MKENIEDRKVNGQIPKPDTTLKPVDIEGLFEDSPRELLARAEELRMLAALRALMEAFRGE